MSVSRILPLLYASLLKHINLLDAHLLLVVLSKRFVYLHMCTRFPMYLNLMAQHLIYSDI